MFTRKFLGVLAAAITLALLNGPVRAEPFPEKSIRIVVPFPAGSGTDYVARLVGGQLSRTTGQTVIVENRPGANGIIGAQEVAKARPDGYTLLITTGSTHAANPSLFKKLPYDPVKDFSPVTTIAFTALVLVANPNLPANTPQELALLARGSPGKVTFASGNAPSRIGGEMFKMMANVDIVNVPSRGAPQGLADVAGGHISIMWTDLITGIPLIESGKVKALAVTSRTRLRMAPTIPTMIESGYRDYVLFNWAGMYAPANTPPEIIKTLNRLVRDAVQSERDRYEKNGSEIMLMSPEEFATLQAADTLMWSRVTKAAGMEPE